MKNVLVTIIIPSFNRCHLINETLKSVELQSYPYWECIVVDDGSSDGTQQVIKKYVQKDIRFKFYQRIKLPKGAGNCRNIGIENAKGDYIIFLDSDDLLAQNSLKRRIEMVNEYSVLDFAVFPMGIFFNTVGDRENIWLFNDFQNYISGFLKRAQWPITSPIWKKESLQKLAGFDITLLSWQDWDLHIRALAEGLQFKIFNESPDCYCRRGEHGQLNHQHTSLEHAKNRIDLFEKIFHLLSSKGLLLEINKKLMAEQYLIACTILHRNNMQKEAVKIWKSVYQRNMIPFRQFCIGLILIKISCPRILFDTRISFHIWIRVLRRIRKGLFYKTYTA